MIIHALIKAILGLISMIWVSSAKERLDELERAGECVNCGSQRVVTEGGSISFEECGCEGRVERGGRVTPHSIQSVYDAHSCADSDGITNLYF